MAITKDKPSNGHTSGVYEQGATRLPPHSEDAEAAVIGSILIDPDRFPELTITSNMFYRAVNRDIFKAFEKLHENKIAIDSITVGDLLEPTMENAYAIIVGYVGAVATSSNLKSYEAIVRVKYLKRQAISLAGKMANEAYDEESTLDDVVSLTQTGIRDIAGEGSKKDPVSAREASETIYDSLTHRREEKDAFNKDFLQTGFLDLDRLLGGIEPGSVFTLAGRPGMGKSLLEQAIRLNVARSGKYVAAFNLEMTQEQMMIRAISAISKIAYKRIQNPYTLSPEAWNHVNKSIGIISELPMYLDACASLTIDQFEAKVHRLFADHGHFDLITLDYIQLMQGNKFARNREQEISQISRGVKQLAKELNTVIMSLAQINRGVEHRNIKVPILADLRESGSIEQDSDVVAFIYRDEYYNEATERPNIATIPVAKNRNAKTGEVDLFFSGEKMLFRNLSRESVSF